LKDDDFILVERKKSKKPPTIPSNPIKKYKMRSKPLIGSSTATSTLSSIPKNVHLHVSRLTPDTEAEILQGYLRPFVISISSCEKLKSKRPEVYVLIVQDLTPRFRIGKSYGSTNLAPRHIN
jgi:hypothetical protein